MRVARCEGRSLPRYNDIFDYFTAISLCREFRYSAPLAYRYKILRLIKNNYQCDTDKFSYLSMLLPFYVYCIICVPIVEQNILTGTALFQ